MNSTNGKSEIKPLNPDNNSNEETNVTEKVLPVLELNCDDNEDSKSHFVSTCLEDVCFQERKPETENDNICYEKSESHNPVCETIPTNKGETCNNSLNDFVNNSLRQESPDKGRKRKASENDSEDEIMKEMELDNQKTDLDNGQKIERKGM